MAVFAFPASASEQSPLEGRNVRHITVNDGLASNAIYSFCQDSKGRMWIGTIDGIHSFDGYQVREWRDESETSVGAVISSIVEDDDNRLWIGSNSGVAVYDLRKEKFEPIPINPQSGVRIKSHVNCIMTDKDGKLWFATKGEGLFSYDPATSMLRQFTGIAKIPSDISRVVFEDSSGEIWAGTHHGLCRFNPEQDRFVHMAENDTPTMSVTAIFEDGNHNLWIGTGGEGLFLYDRGQDRLVPKLIPENEHSIFMVRSIVEWMPGELLIASDRGLTSYRPATGESHIDTTAAYQANTLNDDYLQSLFVDRDGALWIGTYFGGVNYVSPEKHMFTHHHTMNSNLEAKIIGVFAHADNGNIWIGSDDAGVYYWDRKTDNFVKLNVHPLLRDSAHKNIHALLQDGNKLFIGMYLGGLNIVDLKTGEVKNHIFGDTPNSLYASSVYALLKDTYGNIWVGTSQGLNKYNEQTDDFERIFEVYPADVCFIMEDRKGYLWACSTDNGIFRLDRKTRRWEQFKSDGDGSLPAKSVVTAECDEMGNLWFGTDGGGLLRFDYDANEFVRQPLPETFRVINKIVAKNGNLWLATTKGLLCYNPDTGMFNVFDKDNGLQDNVFLPNAGIMTTDGHVLMGGVNGFNEFAPDVIRPRLNSQEVVFSDFQLFNHPVEIGGKDSPLKESITYADEVVLDNSQKVISFKVTPISYVNPSQNKYLYMLEGFDKDWNEAASGFPHAYTNLHAGNYVFKVRCADGSGGYNDTVYSFRLKVLPPWWLSSWMIALYVLVSICLLTLCYRRIVRNQKERFRKLSDLKDRELYQSRMEFFTHIVHEIRTPLTLILSPLESIMNHDGKIADCHKQLSVMERNAKRLLSLVNHLMDFRKMESGMVKLEMAPRDLRELLFGITQNFMLTATLRQLNVRVDISDTPCVANIDTEAFRQIVDNLLSNALKFSNSKIQISLIVLEPGEIVLSVWNDGPHIPEEEQSKIFEPFYQVSQHRPKDNIGTGIGLLLVKRYASLLDAKVEFASSPGEGADFRIIFKRLDIEPESAVSLPAEESINRIPQDEAAVADNNSRPRILVVDDNSDMTEFLADFLSASYEVATALSADEALKAIDNLLPDLIISDVMMPGMDGMEFCRLIKQNVLTSHIPVVLLTAKVSDEDFISGFNNRADLYVTKPFSPDVLLSQLHSILANRATLRDKFKMNPSIISEQMPESSPDKEFFTKIKGIVEERMDDPEFCVDLLARLVGISRTGLFTKIKAMAGMTPNEYIRKIRLQKAADLLLQSEMSVSDVCWEVGFSSRSHFAKCFQSSYGCPPSGYRQMMGKKATG